MFDITYYRINENDEWERQIRTYKTSKDDDGVFSTDFVSQTEWKKTNEIIKDGNIYKLKNGDKKLVKDEDGYRYELIDAILQKGYKDEYLTEKDAYLVSGIEIGF